MVNKRNWSFELELSVLFLFIFFCWFVTVDCGEDVVREVEERIVKNQRIRKDLRGKKKGELGGDDFIE